MRTREDIESLLYMKRQERESQLRVMETDENPSPVNELFQALTLSQIRTLEWVLEGEDEKIPEEKIIDEKFLWLQVLHIVEDTLPTDNPATGYKTIKRLFEQFEIKKRE